MRAGSEEPLATVHERARALAEALTDPRTPGDWEPLARALEHGLEAGGLRRVSSPSARRRAVGELVVVALDARRRRQVGGQ